MANPFDDVVLGIAEHMATWQSRTAQDVLDALEGVGEVADALRAALHDMHESIEGDQRLLKPVGAPVVDALRMMAGPAAQIRDIAQEAAANFRADNKFWLEGQ